MFYIDSNCYSVKKLPTHATQNCQILVTLPAVDITPKEIMFIAFSIGGYWDHDLYRVFYSPKLSKMINIIYCFFLIVTFVLFYVKGNSQGSNHSF